MVKLAMGVGKPTGAEGSAAFSADGPAAAPSMPCRAELGEDPRATRSAGAFFGSCFASRFGSCFASLFGSCLGCFAATGAATWPGRDAEALAFPPTGFAATFEAVDGCLPGRTATGLAGLRAGGAALLADLAGFRAAFAPLPAFATFDRSALAAFGLAARRPAGTGFRFGAVFAFRI